NPGRLPRWFAPVSGDFRLGGRYQVEGNAGGEITRCEPPQHLALTWEMHGAVSWVDVRLTAESGGRTQLYLEHTAHVPDDFWKQFGPGAVGVGWEQALLGLDQHFSTEASVSPDNAEAWIASDNGREFIKASSDAWADASMASGTPAAAAREAGERTRAFYTGD